ncbi:hypothetical protein D1007_47762 [Hordeum vulgare]|nr:hypothetical protein D1007_47762 [Hordeum vulgare]
MAPAPEDRSWIFTSLTVRLLIARPSTVGGGGGDDDEYALLLLGKLDQQGDALLVWRPSSSSSTVRPWSEVRLVSFPTSGITGGKSEADVTFSANGMGCWADLLRGGIYCNLDTLFNNHRDKDKQPLLKFHHFPLPKELANKMSEDGCRGSIWVAQPKAYRTVGAVQNTVLFVSVDGFLERVKNKDRAVSVWSLHTKDMEWYLITKVNLTALRQLIPWIRQRASGISPNVPPSQPHRRGSSRNKMDELIFQLIIISSQDWPSQVFVSLNLGAPHCNLSAISLSLNVRTPIFDTDLEHHSGVIME